MSSAGNLEKKLLLEVARRAMSAAVEGRELAGTLPDIPNRCDSGGVFVTLHRRGRLRGCVGQVLPKSSLVETIAYCAKAAALEDPRFEPVRPDESPEIEIELSVLSPLETIAPEQIQAGKHGLMVSSGRQRGVLLPQVAVQFRWDGLRLLEETCAKAGFDRDAWKKPDVRVEAFTAEIFSEADVRDSSTAKAETQAGSKPGYSSST
ncbi:MAG TPA: AmmeMemoRadiSam system protein A [Candidatus Acidoferrales bacterium]|jgi:AmmeMemoRadiSam system protein A|nr:AmmeMemoRadiSam system protein A [Candidatus Acidoferrales bacterium]